MNDAPTDKQLGLPKGTQDRVAQVERESWKTAHALARELLAGPDLIVVTAVPVFDMPGCAHAMPVKASRKTIEGTDCVVIGSA